MMHQRPGPPTVPTLAAAPSCPTRGRSTPPRAGATRACFLESGDRSVQSGHARGVLSVFRRSGLDDGRISAVLALADVGGDGMLSLDEFCVAFHMVGTVAHRGVAVPASLPGVAARADSGACKRASTPATTLRGRRRALTRWIWESLAAPGVSSRAGGGRRRATTAAAARVSPPRLEPGRQSLSCCRRSARFARSTPQRLLLDQECGESQRPGLGRKRERAAVDWRPRRPPPCPRGTACTAFDGVRGASSDGISRADSFDPFGLEENERENEERRKRQWRRRPRPEAGAGAGAGAGGAGPSDGRGAAPVPPPRRTKRQSVSRNVINMFDKKMAARTWRRRKTGSSPRRALRDPLPAGSSCARKKKKALSLTNWKKRRVVFSVRASARTRRGNSEPSEEMLLQATTTVRPFTNPNKDTAKHGFTLMDVVEVPARAAKGVYRARGLGGQGGRVDSKDRRDVGKDESGAPTPVRCGRAGAAAAAGATPCWGTMAPRAGRRRR